MFKTLDIKQGFSKSLTMVMAAVVLGAGLIGAAPKAAQADDNGVVGSLIGAGLGGLLGSQIGSGSGRLAAVALGTLGGAVIGGNAARASNHGHGHVYHGQQRPVYYAKPKRVYREVPRYVYKPKKVVVVERETVYVKRRPAAKRGFDRRLEREIRRGRVCQEFRNIVEIGGQLEEVDGIACQRRDGTWKIIR